MLGLCLYYVTLLKKRIFLIIGLIGIVLLIGFTEKAYGLAIIYLMSFPIFIFTETEKQHYQNTLFEKTLPVKQSKIVLVKYIVFVITIVLSLTTSYVYLILVSHFESNSFDFKSQITFMLEILSVVISFGTYMIMSSSMNRTGLKRIVVLLIFFILPMLSIFRHVTWDNWDVFFNSLVSSLFNNNFKETLIVSLLFFLISYPVAVYLQKDKTV